MDKYGLLGFPLGHSFSKDFFNEKFKNERIDAVYTNYELPDINMLPNVLSANPELKGLNVTIPYKEKVISYLNEVTPEARAIGAVNVVKLEKRGKKDYLVGYNSDVLGFTRSIEPLLKPSHKKALILGTGGASKAVEYGLQQMGLQTIKVSRSKRPNTLTYDDINEQLLQEYTVIVNTTPVGMYPHTDECPNLPYQFMDHRHLLYDLVYNPDTTLFMHKGKEQGCKVKNGLEMLLLQAYASWDIWNGTEK